MKRWSVELPICGRAILEVEADTEASAITFALGECSIEHIEEWDPKRRIVEGNVCYAPLNRALATEIEED